MSWFAFMVFPLLLRLGWFFITFRSLDSNLSRLFKALCSLGRFAGSVRQDTRLLLSQVRSGRYNSSRSDQAPGEFHLLYLPASELSSRL